MNKAIDGKESGHVGSIGLGYFIYREIIMERPSELLPPKKECH